MNKVRKIKQAAKILSSFNFEGAGSDFYDISIYFRTASGDIAGTGTDVIKCRGKKHPMTWSRNEWEAFISEKAERYYQIDFEPAYVESIRIAFELNEDTNKEDADDDLLHSAPLYTIEMTDVGSGLFNRMIVRGGIEDRLKEVYLTEPESRKIRGVHDVVKRNLGISRARLKFVRSDLPVCIARIRGY